MWTLDSLTENDRMLPTKYQEGAVSTPVLLGGGKTCRYCFNLALKQMKVTSRTAGRVKCDVGEYDPEAICPLNGECVAEGNKFYGCPRCEEVDLCEDCYDKPLPQSRRHLITAIEPMNSCHLTF